MNKTLTICIPSYNRSHLIIPLLNSLKQVVEIYKSTVKLIVSENFSSKENQTIIRDYYNKNPFFILYQNNKNIGAIENIYFLLNKVDTEFVWFFSDDDLLVDGAIKKILKIIGQNNVDLMFVEYQSFKDKPENIINKLDLLGYSGLYSESKKILIELTDKNGEIFMFISSLIFKIEKLKEFIFNNSTLTLVDPIKFSFYCGMKNLFILSEPLVLQRSSNASWSSVGPKLFSWEYQNSLTEFQKYYYDRLEIKRLIKSSYLNKRGNYLRMLFFSPTKQKFNIIFCLRGSNFYLLIDSVVYNVKKLF